MSLFSLKYLKYKQKYLNLRGGDSPVNLEFVENNPTRTYFLNGKKIGILKDYIKKLIEWDSGPVYSREYIFSNGKSYSATELHNNITVETIAL